MTEHQRGIALVINNFFDTKTGNTSTHKGTGISEKIISKKI